MINEPSQVVENRAIIILMDIHDTIILLQIGAECRLLAILDSITCKNAAAWRQHRWRR